MLGGKNPADGPGASSRAIEIGQDGSEESFKPRESKHLFLEHDWPDLQGSSGDVVTSTPDGRPRQGAGQGVPVRLCV